MMKGPRQFCLGLLLLLSFSFQTQADTQGERFFCAHTKGKELLKDYESYPFSSDKSKHCAFSCMLSFECGGLQAYLLGLAKEFHDALGYGDPDEKDLAANQVGLTLAKEVSTEAECLSECDKEY